MTLSTGHSASWQSKVAYAAALLFTLTSAATNAKYGYAKGADLPSALIWLTVSVAASIVFALGVPALLRSIAAKKLAQSLLVCVGLVTCGSYSIVAALGSASGGRMNAAAEEQGVTDQRAKAQATWQSAKKELETLATTKPGAELQQLIQAARDELGRLPEARPVAEIDARLRVIERDPRRYGCAPMNGSMKVFCPTLSPERARAVQREELAAQIAKWTAEIGSAGQRHAEAQARAQATMDKAAADLANTAPAKVANSDAAALSDYLAALGWTVTPDVLNKLLALLAVLVIELGGGASLAIGMALGDRAADQLRPQRSDTAGVNGVRSGVNPGVQGVVDAGVYTRLEPAPIMGNGRQQQGGRSARARVLQALMEAGGVLTGSQQGMSTTFGWSKSRMNAVLHELKAAGLVRLSTGKSGTVVRLIEGGRA